MPMFRNYADYDKWRRRTLLKKLRQSSIAAIAAEAGGQSFPSANDAETAAGNRAQNEQIFNRQLAAGHPLKGFSRSPSFKSGGGGSVNMVQDGGAFWSEITDNDALTFGVEIENLTFSLWLEVPDPPAGAVWTIFDNQTAGRQQQLKVLGAQGTDLGWDFRDFLGTQRGTGTATDALTHDTMQHIMVSMSTQDFSDAWGVWVNGVSVGSGTWGSANGIAPFEWWFQTDDGSTYDGGGIASQAAQFGDYWMGLEYVADPTGVFIDGSGAPLVAGADGSGYTGRQPEIYIGGNAAAWNSGTNTGAGGDLTVSGTVTDA